MTTSLQQFFYATKGNVAMIFALCVGPIFLFMTFAIDSTRQVIADRHVQAALDAASLAAAIALEDKSLTNPQVREIALNSFQANLQTAHGDLTCSDTEILINRDDLMISMDAACEVPSVYGASLPLQSLKIANRASAQTAVSKLDLAMMLDVSGSMEGLRLEQLKTAAKDTAEKLLELSPDDRVRVSFASYATSVNAGEYGNAALGRAPYDDSDEDGLEKVCVAERTGPSARRDHAPGPGRYMSDRATQCPDSSILPLTSDFTEFSQEIDRREADGMTAGHLGVAWSWYLISPEWRDVWPATSAPLDYDEPNSLKAVILMSDGRFNEFYHPELGRSNWQAMRMCEAMRNSDVLVYAVAFNAPTRAQWTLENCAGAEERFFVANSGEELLDAYAAIAGQLSELTLVD